jgi:serine/threonine-protein kinase
LQYLFYRPTVTDVTASALADALRDRYTIERELGRGGWATVYLAQDLRHDRPVALKVLRPDLAVALGPSRFLREIAIAGRLTHPHILPLYDSGRVPLSTSQGESLYFVMPFVEGETLRQRLKREHQLPLADALAITRQVADALAFAHAHNVMHRDIKPENILLDATQAYVADFGTARAIVVAAGDTLSSPGLAVGTPAYMSPEQASGSDDLDGRSDEYGLACVLYEMLTGEPPHTGNTAQVILARHQMDTPRSIRVLRPSLPEEVEHVIFKALAKVPADRYSTVSEFAGALTPAGDVRRPDGRRSWGRHAVLLLGLSLGVAGLVWLARHQLSPAATVERGTADPTHIAVLYFDDKSDGGSLRSVASGLTEDLIDVLGQVRELHVVSPNGVRPFLERHPPPDSIGRALQVGTLVGGSVERSGDVLRVTVRLIDAPSGMQLQSRTLQYPMVDLFTLQDTLAQEVSRFLRERLGEEVLLRERRKGTRNVSAWERTQDGEQWREAARVLRAEGAAAEADRALDNADSLFSVAARTDPGWPDPVVLRGWVAGDRMELSDIKPLDSVRTWYRQGVEQADHALRIHPGHSPALELRGTLRFRHWLEGGSAQTELAGAEQDLKAAAVPDNPRLARTWGTLSALLQASGKLAEANLLARRAYETDAYLAESPQLLFRLYYTALDLGKEQEAVRWCEIGYKRFAEDWHFTFCRLTILAWSGVTPDARAAIDTAWQMLAQLERLTPPEDRAALPRWRIRVAGVIGRAGLRDSAEAVIKRARTLAPNDREMDFYEAEARVLLGDREAALKLLARDLAANPQFREYTRVYPVFRPLWSDPRFMALVQKPDKDSARPQ